MPIRTWLRYLIGDRQAILEIAGNRYALWLGFLFVLSAGFAREYDGEDLLHDPWYLLLPFAASLAASFLLFSLTYGIAKAKRATLPPFSAGYRTFLGLFWLTAPLASLYAVPYERFLSPVDAMAANLWTLGIVSAWRVFLMIRVVSVLIGYHTLAAVFLVMVLADLEVFLAMQFVPVLLLDMMGGLRLTESEALLKRIACDVLVSSVNSFPVWLIGAIVAAFKSRPTWNAPPNSSRRDQRWGVWLLAAASLAVWPFVLPYTQPEQKLRRQVESHLESSQIAEGLRLMSEHSPLDFPPHWDPPPRMGFRGSRPDLLTVMEFIAQTPPAPWVQDIYEAKLIEFVGDPWVISSLDAVARLLIRLPHGDRIHATIQERHGRADVVDSFRRWGAADYAKKLNEHYTKLKRDASSPP